VDITVFDELLGMTYVYKAN